MSLHDHDRDLIMALAEGSLDATAARTARAQIDSCAECRTELELQATALAMFATAPPATMTDVEAARLKRDLDTALGHERTVVAVTPPKRRFNWVPVFSVAAVLLALVLVAPALELVGGSGDDAADQVVGLDEIEEQGDGDEATEPQEGLLRTQDLENSFVADAPAAAEAAPTTTAAAAADDAGDAAPPSDVETLLAELDEALSETDSVDDARLKAAQFGLLIPEEDPVDLERCVLVGAAEFNVTGVDSYTVGLTEFDVGLVRVTAHPMRNVLGLAAHLESTCVVIDTNDG